MHVFVAKWARYLLVFLGLGVAVSCGDAETFDEPTVDGHSTELTSKQRRDTAETIRDVAAKQGITNFWLLAGIASGESTMAHCQSDATWSCKGPRSDDCNGPVLAGSSDGPCSEEQGGLGLFQLDAGKYDDTIRREGNRVLSLRGNIEAATEFVISMVIASTSISNVSTRAQAIQWINAVRPGTPEYNAWIQTVTELYNGCRRGSCSIYDQRFAHYDRHAMARYREFGQGFWFPGSGGNNSAAVLEQKTINLKKFDFYKKPYTVPAGWDSFLVELKSGSGDLDLFVYRGSPPELPSSSCQPTVPANAPAVRCHSYGKTDEEECRFEPPEPGVYHVLVFACTGSTGGVLTVSGK